MVTYMNEMRVKRLARERLQLINVRKTAAIAILRDYKNAQLPYTSFMPEPVDFCAFPPIQAILQLPSEKTVDLSTFDDVLPLLPGLIEDWRKKVLFELSTVSKGRTVRKRVEDTALVTGHAPKVTDLDKRSEEILQLASATFTCSKCTPYAFQRKVAIGPLLTYPDVLAHSCLTRTNKYCMEQEEEEDPSMRLQEGHSLRRTGWSVKLLSIDAKLNAITRHLIRLAELDPTKATVAEMDALESYFVCTHCLTESGGTSSEFTAEVFGWRAAVRSALIHTSPVLLTVPLHRLRTL